MWARREKVGREGRQGEVEGKEDRGVEYELKSEGKGKRKREH